jgi:hypothetical protein
MACYTSHADLLADCKFNWRKASFLGVEQSVEDFIECTRIRATDVAGR